MKISVTMEDILMGNKNDCDKCAISLAIRRCLNVNHAQIEDAFDIWCDGLAYKVKGDADVLKVDAFIRAFDKGETVAPFSFEIERKYDDESEDEE